MTLLSEAEIELFAAASKVDNCHAHRHCSRCHPELTDALDAFVKAHPGVDFADLLDTYWFGSGEEGTPPSHTQPNDGQAEADRTSYGPDSSL